MQTFAAFERDFEGLDEEEDSDRFRGRDVDDWPPASTFCRAAEFAEDLLEDVMSSRWFLTLW